MRRREFITLLGGVALCGAINVNWLTHARACVLFSQPRKT
jgi:hypothetical protein